MSKPTGVSLKDFCKAVEISAGVCGYDHVSHGPKKGSVYAFQFFQHAQSSQPDSIFVVHTGHNKKKEIWSDDLKKAWERTAISEEIFKGILNKL